MSGSLVSFAGLEITWRAAPVLNCLLQCVPHLTHSAALKLVSAALLQACSCCCAGLHPSCCPPSLHCSASQLAQWPTP